MRMRKWMITALLIGVAALPGIMQAQCTAVNDAFKSGETLVYDLYFNWKFVWVKVGSASMTVTSTVYDGEPAYRCHLITRGNKRADRFFVMRDTLVSIVGEQLEPYYFRKGALEGDRYKVDEVWYDYPGTGGVHLKQRYRNHRGNVSTAEHESPECIYDMLSMMLRARSFDVTDYKVGQKLKFPMADGDDVKEETLVYRGKRKFTMENTNITYRCLVFSFVEYEDGKEQEVITFYVTDDRNHLPVRLDMFLRFGSAKAFLTGTRNVRHPQTSVIK